MLRFSIYRPDSIVVVDNAPIVTSLTGLAANIVVVAFQDDKGSVEYNDRPPMRTPFTDPSPYQPLINSWITAYATASPPLQLAQAKQVKSDLVESIFHHKRHTPYNFSGWLFEATDDALWSLTELVEATQAVSSDAGGIVTAINAAFTTLTAQINNQVVTVNNGSANAVNGWSALHDVNFGRVSREDTQPPASGSRAVMMTSKSDPWQSGLGSGGFAAMSGLAGASISGVVSTGLSHPGNITLTPLNSATAQTFTAEQVHTVMQAMAARRNTLSTNRLGKQAAINALTTVAAVAAYDATTGWSF